MNTQQHKKLCITGSAFAMGLAYYIMLTRFSFGIPCLFRKITGLLCPGCGVTHMIYYMSILDLKDAFMSNPVLFVLQPGIYYFIVKSYVYWLKGEKWESSKLENAMLVIMIEILVIWGVVRNLM